MADYQDVDFLRLDELLSDEDRLARDTVREWVTNEFLPRVQEHIRQDGSFPMELVPQMAELGLFGSNLKGYGCAGLNNIAYGLIMQELERGDSGLRSFASVQGSLVMYPIYTYGSDAQKDRWLPELAAGRAIGCFGLTEPDAGSHVGGMRTRAVRTDEGWILGTPGFEARDIKGKFSLRGSVTSELYMTDVVVPEENRLPKAESLRAPLSCLTQARYGIAWGAIGAAMACYDEARQYSLAREVQGGVLASKQITQEKLVFILTEITKAQLLALRVAQIKDAGSLEPVMISMIKRNNVDIALQIARLARDLLGANGIVDDYQAMRHMVNLETVRTYEGTHDVHTLILGEHITGHRAI
jgi:glutaryl-CoA dehydrogenase